MRRLLVGLQLVLVAAVTACGGSSSPSGTALTPVTVGYFGDWESSYVVSVGTREGFFKAAGLDATGAQFNSGPPAVAALSSGSLNFAFIGPGPIKLAMSGQAVILGINDLSVTDYLIAKSGINSVADLKGKTVIYAQGTVEEVILALALSQVNMKPSDVKLVNVPDFATQVSAYLSGTADAIAASAPFSNTILQKDTSSHILFSDGNIYPKLVMPDSWVTSAAMLKDHRDTVVRFMWALEKIEAWSLAHVDGSVNDTAQFTKQTADVIKQNAPPDNAKIVPPTDLIGYYKDGTAQGWYQAIGNIFVEIGRIPSVPAPSTYLDFGPAIDASKTINQASY